MILAYLACQLPFNYGIISMLLEKEIKEKFPLFKPKTILDFGCGPGTAIW